MASVTKDGPKNDSEQVRQHRHDVDHELHQAQPEWDQTPQQFKQIENYDDHSEQEANSKHNDAAYHPKRAVEPFGIYKVISGGSDDDTSQEGFWRAETSSQAAQVAAWKRLIMHHSVDQEANSCNQRGDETQYAADAGEADKNSCEDDGGWGDHLGAQSGQPAGQAGPVWEDGGHEDLPL